MDPAKQRRLEAKGWRVGTAAEFLGLTPDEAAYIEMKYTLSRRLRTAREKAGLTQAELAERLGSSQSRVAKMEAGDRTVSIDLLLRALLQLGLTQRQIARAIGP